MTLPHPWRKTNRSIPLLTPVNPCRTLPLNVSIWCYFFRIVLSYPKLFNQRLQNISFGKIRSNHSQNKIYSTYYICWRKLYKYHLRRKVFDLLREPGWLIESLDISSFKMLMFPKRYTYVHIYKKHVSVYRCNR